jgi:hypothetical protein
MEVDGEQRHLVTLRDSPPELGLCRVFWMHKAHATIRP